MYEGYFLELLPRRLMIDRVGFDRSDKRHTVSHALVDIGKGILFGDVDFHVENATVVKVKVPSRAGAASFLLERGRLYKLYDDCLVRLGPVVSHRHRLFRVVVPLEPRRIEWMRGTFSKSFHILPDDEDLFATDGVIRAHPVEDHPRKKGVRWQAVDIADATFLVLQKRSRLNPPDSNHHRHWFCRGNGLWHLFGGTAYMSDRADPSHLAALLFSHRWSHYHWML